MDVTGQRPVQVAVVSDREVVTQGIAAMLAPRPDLVLMRKVPLTPAGLGQIDVVLVDGYGGPPVVRRTCALLREVAPTPQLVLLDRPQCEGAKQDILDLGVAGFLPASVTVPELLDAITAVAHGRTYLALAPPPGDDLSARQREILSLIVDGLDNRAIADKLFISDNTLKTHVRTIYRKLDVTRRSQAVSWGMQHGYGG